jgi:hypothetical protein
VSVKEAGMAQVKEVVKKVETLRVPRTAEGREPPVEVHHEDVDEEIFECSPAQVLREYSPSPVRTTFAAFMQARRHHDE